MKKIFVCCFLLTLCACSEVKDPMKTTVDNVNDSKEWSARESVKGFANSVNIAYMNYLSYGETGDTSVMIDGEPTNLNIIYSGIDISCSNISIIKGSVKLERCKVYNYEFDYNGSVIKK